MKVGLSLPHFGADLIKRDVLQVAVDAESAGFDSLWLRDHIFLAPKVPGTDGTPTYDSVTTITAVSARTSRITIGTAALIPLRHPVMMAQISATLVHLFGSRFIWGVGSGNSEREFASIGLGGRNRAADVLASINVMRALWSGREVSWDDEQYRFDPITLTPRLHERPVPFWYCANNPKSARLAAQVCDGWLPGRVNLPTLRKRIESIDALVAEDGRPRPTIGTMPYVSVAGTREAAVARVDVGGLLEQANHARFWVKPESGSFASVDDLDGMLMCGTPEQIIEQCAALAQAGVEHVVFDLRQGFSAWDEQFDLLADTVLPAVHAMGAQ